MRTIPRANMPGHWSIAVIRHRPGESRSADHTLFCTSRRHQASKDGETKATESLLLGGGALPLAPARDKGVADER